MFHGVKCAIMGKIAVEEDVMIDHMNRAGPFGWGNSLDDLDRITNSYFHFGGSNQKNEKECPDRIPKIISSTMVPKGEIWIITSKSRITIRNVDDELEFAS